MLKYGKAVQFFYQFLYLIYIFSRQEYPNQIVYHLNKTDLKWYDIFEILENEKLEINTSIEDYAIEQTYLEQVFLSFIKSQRENVQKP